MNISIECKSSIYLEAKKDIAKIVKWVEKNSDRYKNIVSQVNGCLLVTKDGLNDWCTFESVNCIGDIEKFKTRISNTELLSQLSALANKIKGYDHEIITFDSNPVGIYPCFMFTKKQYLFSVVFYHDDEVDIHVTWKN